MGISTDSKSTDLRTRSDNFRQPCGQACKRTKQEGDRASGHARGRVRQRRAAQVGERIVSSHRLQGKEEKANGRGRSEMPTIGGWRCGCLTTASFWELVKRERRLGLDVDRPPALRGGPVVERRPWAVRWRESALCMSCIHSEARLIPTDGDCRFRRVCYDLEMPGRPA